MINLLSNEFDNSFSNSLIDFNNKEENLFSFSFPSEENAIKKNLFITKKTMKEKIKHQKLILGKENDKQILFDKKEDLKRRNREAAQKSRNKKKLELNNLLEENKILKDKIYIINSKINLLCTHCKNILEYKNQIDILDNNNKKEKIEMKEQKNNECINCESLELDENINNTQFSSFFINLKIQKIFNFSLLGLITFLCIICFFSNMNFINNNNYLRKNQEISIIHENNNNTSNQEQIENKKEKDKGICEKDFFSSFQCKKKSFASMLNDINIIDENNNREKDNINNIKIRENDQNKFLKNKEKNQNSIYFKLFVQSCDLEDEPENNNNVIINDNKHYVFSTDKSPYHDFYFFCQKTDD